MSTKKTVPKKATKKTVKAVKRGNPKPAKLVKNKSNKKDIVEAKDIQAIVENPITIEEDNTDVDVNPNAIVLVSKETEQPLSTIDKDVSSAYIEYNNEPYINTALYSNIDIHEKKDRTGFYIGLFGAIVVILWMLFI